MLLCFLGFGDATRWLHTRSDSFVDRSAQHEPYYILSSGTQHSTRLARVYVITYQLSVYLLKELTIWMLRGFEKITPGAGRRNYQLFQTSKSGQTISFILFSRLSVVESCQPASPIRFCCSHEINTQLMKDLIVANPDIALHIHSIEMNQSEWTTGFSWVLGQLTNLIL